jgi:endogenous inhibitor of DNA gyrase (YacG/DUF329 family)
MSEPTCPICDRRLEGPVSNWPQFPFCSPKCRLVDLGRWLSDSYGLPKDDPDEDDELPVDPSDLA